MGCLPRAPLSPIRTISVARIVGRSIFVRTASHRHPQKPTSLIATRLVAFALQAAPSFRTWMPVWLSSLPPSEQVLSVGSEACSCGPLYSLACADDVERALLSNILRCIVFKANATSTCSRRWQHDFSSPPARGEQSDTDTHPSHVACSSR